MIYKTTNFSTTFISNFFFCISRLFLRHLDLFLSKDKKMAQTPKQTNKYNFFFRKKYFSSKNASGRSDCSCDNSWTNLPTERFLDQNPKRCGRLTNFQKLFCPKNFHGYVDYEFRKSGKIFHYKLENRSESEKNSEIFSFEKKFSTNCSPGHLLLLCQPWKLISAFVPKSSKTIQKPSRFKDPLSEMLLCSCFSGHTESSFDNPAKIFPIKIEVSFVKIQRKRQNNCPRVLFLTFFLCTLRLLFRHTGFFFANIRKNSPKLHKNVIIV